MADSLRNKMIKELFARHTHYIYKAPVAKHLQGSKSQKNYTNCIILNENFIKILKLLSF